MRYSLQSDARAALIERRIRGLVVACKHPASAFALDALRSHHPALPVIGVIEPGAGGGGCPRLRRSASR